MHDAEECYRLGTDAYPEVAWEWADFVAVWQARAHQPAPDAASAEEFLRLACLERRPSAIAVLEREYIAPLRPSLRRICSTDDLTDQALQELRDKLLLPPGSRLQAYRASGSLRAWLKVVATRTALDVVRRVGAQGRREVLLEDQLEALATGPEQRLLAEELRGLVREALRAAIKRLPEEQRHALQMHVISGFSIDQIGRVLSVHRATVARWLVLAKDALRVTMAEEMARLGAPADDGAFITGLPSRLDLSLSRVFASTGVHDHSDAREA